MNENYLIYGLIGLLAIVSIINTGYDYAEPLYLPLIKYYQDNTLFQEDPYISLLSNLPLYMWQSIGYFTNSSNLEWFMFFLFVFARILLCFSIYFLAFSISKNKLVSLISTIFSILIIWTFNIGNFIMFLSDITPFSFAISVAFFSIGYFIRKNYVVSLLLLTLIAYIHPLTIFYLGVIYSIYFIFNLKEIKKNVFFTGIASLVLILPVVVKSVKSFSLSGTNSFNFTSWLNFVVARDGHHIFPSLWDLRNYILFSLLVIFFFVSLKYNKNREVNRTVFYIGLSTFLMLLTGYIFSEIYPTKEIIGLSLFRSLMFFRVIMFVYISNYLYHSMKRIRLNLEFFYSLFVICLFLGAILGPAIFGNGFSKEIYFPWEKNITSWEDISLKTKEFTPKNALVIIPPFEKSFMVFSDRNSYFGWTEVGSFLYFPNLAEREFNKLIDLCGPFDKYDVWEIKEECDENIKKIDKSKLNELKKRYGATYIILKTPNNLDLIVLYKNEDFVLYQI